MAFWNTGPSREEVLLKALDAMHSEALAIADAAKALANANAASAAVLTQYLDLFKPTRAPRAMVSDDKQEQKTYLSGVKDEYALAKALFEEFEHDGH